MSQHPNVIILVLDTARAQNFSCYGYERPTTPHIDAVAADGTLCEQTIATGCWSLPSQVSLLTGTFPATHGAHEQHLRYDHTYPMLPEVLQDAGYRTLGVSPNGWMSDEFGVTHGFDTYLKLWQYWPTMPAPIPDALRLAQPLIRRVNRLYSHYVFPRRNRARHIRSHIVKLLSQTPEPFFLYAIYWDVHLPYYPYGQHVTRWLPAGVTAEQAIRVNRSHHAYLTGQTPMTEEDFAILRACYDGALASIDAEIGALVAWLKRRELLDRTLLMITSDHGENIGEHNLMSHAYSLHDTLIRVPLIIRYPACFPAGQRVGQQVQLTDLFPTILDTLRLDAPHVRQAFEGESLLASAGTAADRLAYAEMFGPHPTIQTLNRCAGFPENTPQPAYDRALRCLRTADHKIIWASDGQHALYDLRRDPHETANCFTDEPKLAAELLDTLQLWRSPQHTPRHVSAADFDQDLRKRLRDLGYID